MGDHADLTRRRFLTTTVGGLPTLAASLLPEVVAAPDHTRSGSFGKAKSVVVLYLYGAPSQMDTLDPKPDAPQERRGEFGSVATRFPGVRVCEHLPRIARVLDRMCLVRSMSHTSNNHAVSVALSGLSRSQPAIEANRADSQHWPYFGSVLEYLWKQQGRDAADTGLPVNVILPWPLNARVTRTAGHRTRRGSRSAHNRCTHCSAARARMMSGIRRRTADGSPRSPRPLRWGNANKRLCSRVELPAEVSAVRFTDRLQLLHCQNTSGPGSGEADRFRRYQRAAVRMIADPRIARAVDVTREPPAVRDRYGLTLFGMEALAARRLIEAGVKLVTAFWDDYAFGNNAWDTHYNHFPRLKEGLCPIFDQVLTAFLEDMEQRGLLDQTLVMVISEHGRTPAIASVVGGGRDHWAGAYWGLFFGAGIRTGQVIGATDRQGAFPTARPIDPKDILATMYHLLGIDAAETMIPDRSNRPTHLLPHGSAVPELLV